MMSPVPEMKLPEVRQKDIRDLRASPGRSRLRGNRVDCNRLQKTEKSKCKLRGSDSNENIQERETVL